MGAVKERKRGYAAPVRVPIVKTPVEGVTFPEPEFELGIDQRTQTRSPTSEVE